MSGGGQGARREGWWVENTSLYAIDGYDKLDILVNVASNRIVGDIYFT